MSAGVLMNRATRRAFEILDRLVAERTIGMAIANPGVAKSYSIKAWRQRRPNVRHCWIEADVLTAARPLLNALMQGLKLGSRTHVNMAVSKVGICEALAADPVLVIIDEADLLTVRTFDVLRSIWDRVAELRDTDGESAFPLALFGTPHLREMLMRPDLERLRRRVSEQAELPPMNEREVELALHYKWPELKFDQDGLLALTQLSQGAFGWLNRIVPIAEKLAAKDGKMVGAAIVQATSKYLIGLENR
jgi:type II secretory pathway predicted ATPase ExeA